MLSIKYEKIQEELIQKYGYAPEELILQFMLTETAKEIAAKTQDELSKEAVRIFHKVDKMLAVS